VGERSSEGAAHAAADGVARVAAAPVVLLGMIALVSFYGTPSDPRHAIGALLLWAFLSGGVFDRYARRRPTRARGFFGACGAHLGAMLRLGAAILLVLAVFHLIIGGGFPNHYVHEAAFVMALLLMLVLTFAQVRVAVEDRRSALGALLAAARFVARNPSALLVFAGFAAAALGVVLAWEQYAARDADATGAAWRTWTIAQAAIAIETSLVLAWFATAVSLFQARLAHAGYTAAPALTWPDSPAAEAIANASPTVAP
jgi:hypothetical protein